MTKILMSGQFTWPFKATTGIPSCSITSLKPPQAIGDDKAEFKGNLI